MTRTHTTRLASGPSLQIPSLQIYALDIEDTDNTDNIVWDEETVDTPLTDATDQDLEELEINVQLRVELGRRMTVALLDLPGGGGTAFDELQAALAMYPEVRVLVLRPEQEQDASTLEGMLGEAQREGVDSLLVWTNGEATETDKGDHACSAAESWARLVVSVAERLQLFDRCFIALVGEGVSRVGARKLGYEDGFAIEAPVIQLMRTLVRETLAHEVFSRRGSSPPCYL